MIFDENMKGGNDTITQRLQLGNFVVF